MKEIAAVVEGAVVSLSWAGALARCRGVTSLDDAGNCSSGGASGNKVICPRLQKCLSCVGGHCVCLLRCTYEELCNAHGHFHFSVISVLFLVDLVRDLEHFPAYSGVRLCFRRNVQTRCNHQQNPTYFHEAAFFFFLKTSVKHEHCNM